MNTHTFISQLYQAELAPLYRFFYTRVLEKGIAEDLTGDTFLRFMQSKAQFATYSKARSYLFGIAYNVFKEFLKQQYKIKTVPFDQEEMVNYVEAANTSSTQTDLLRRIKQLLPKLPDAQRKVLQLRLIEKLDLAEICQKLSKDMNYVKTTQKRGIKSLQKLLIVYTGS